MRGRLLCTDCCYRVSVAPDFWPTGWHDNTQSNHREYYRDGVKGRHGHKSGISPDSMHRDFRAQWGSFPDIARHTAQAA